MSQSPPEGSPVLGTILWSAPRSATTAFFRAIESHPDTVLAVLEPYSQAYYFSEERVSKRKLDGPPLPNSGFLDTKRHLEEALARQQQQLREAASSTDGDARRRQKLVFVKDMAYCLPDGRHYPIDLLPRGYRRFAFLVRHPSKVVTSLYRISINKELSGWDYFDSQEVGFKELWELYELLRDTAAAEGEPPPMVIDTDDLLRNPELYLRAYCNYIGLEFNEALLKWKPVSASAIASDPCWTSGWFREVVATDGFRKPRESSVVLSSVGPDEPLPECVTNCIRECMEFYEKFQLVKLRLDSTD